jgi:hypothetical protein
MVQSRNRVGLNYSRGRTSWVFRQRPIPPPLPLSERVMHFLSDAALITWLVALPLIGLYAVAFATAWLLGWL